MYYTIPEPDQNQGLKEDGGWQKRWETIYYTKLLYLEFYESMYDFLAQTTN